MIREINKKKLLKLILNHIKFKRPLLGICVGYQILFENSEEDLKSVKRAPQWLFQLQDGFAWKVEKIKRDLKKIGLMDDIYGPQSEILMNYLKSEMKKIDLEFPMNSPETSYVPPIMKDGSHLI